jgi:2-polyprenyl-6-methoxyphenol hydroxylase-like FAD-dependent oxidoreductase
MPQSSLRVLVIGAGLGGLCLAQGLRKAGVDVAVSERDAGPSTNSGAMRATATSWPPLSTPSCRSRTTGSG